VLFSVMRRNPSFLPFELVKGAMMKAKDEFEARFSTIKNADENRGDDEADAETEQE
jgi:hypothetical protein